MYIDSKKRNTDLSHRQRDEPPPYFVHITLILARGKAARKMTELVSEEDHMSAADAVMKLAHEVSDPSTVLQGLEERVRCIERKLNTPAPLKTSVDPQHFENYEEEEEYWRKKIESLSRPAYNGSRTPRYQGLNRNRREQNRKPDKLDRKFQDDLKRQRLRVARLIRPSNYKCSSPPEKSLRRSTNISRWSPSGTHKDWSPAKDLLSGRIYFYNNKTGETRWA